MSTPAIDLDALQDRLCYRFTNQALLQTALTHPSYRAECADAGEDNQRLEFLGDAVIQIVITDKMFTEFPNDPEGKLTKMRAALTRKSALAKMAREVDLGSCLRLGHGEFINRGYKRDSILCDAFEAVVGAVYLDSDGSLTEARRLVNDLVDGTHGDIAELLHDENPKGALQEWVQREYQTKPEYAVVEVSGPDHDRTYQIHVMISGHCYGCGQAGKRQTAEQNAARDALAQLQAMRREMADTADTETPDQPPLSSAT